MSAIVPAVPREPETLPAQPDAERSLLGALLIDGGLLSRVMEFLVPEDFAAEPHRLVYEAFLTLADRNEARDLITVQSELEKKGKLDRAGGPSYLAGLVDRVPDVENVEAYARLIRESSLRRAVIQQSRQAIREAMEAPDAEVVLENAQRQLVEIAKGSIRGGFVPLARIAERNEEEIQRIHGRGTMLTGLPTGFTRLNALTQGFQKSDLIVVAARPGMGKSAFALNIAAQLAIHQPYTVGFFSLEMSAQQVGFRIQCSEARVNLQRLREGRISKDEKKALFFTLQKIRDAKLFIDDTPAITLLEMRARALQLKQRHGLDALFVDYLQIMGTRGKVENRTQEVSAFSRGLKAIAKELEVPVIALSQLSRRTEQRGTEKEPVLSDLRESGAIEQDADVVIFLSRPEYYDKDTDQKNVCDVIIAKQRNGPTDRFTLGWSGEYTRFSDLAQISEAPGY
ncbi:MAG TPA: replicative DNA helicase [Thermoanaerobaculia bacterium]|nr:replicative DNA helicase [Thermoanaerobaculia bacterium]HQR66263.1 replicative DNA helicase [Thermoanaerobaculia bacterium]